MAASSAPRSITPATVDLIKAIPPKIAAPFLSIPTNSEKESAPLVPAFSSSFPASRADDPRSSRPRPPLFVASDISRPAARADALISRPFCTASSKAACTEEAASADWPSPAAPLTPASYVARPASTAAACTPSSRSCAACTCALKSPAFSKRLTTSSPAFMEFAPKALVVAVHGDDF